MSDNSGWYQRKMAQMRGAPQPQQYQPIPAHYQPPPQQQRVPMQRVSLMPPSAEPQPLPPVTIDNLWHAMNVWHGGKAHKIDPDPCPECGSNQYYSRTQGTRRGPAPAPHCYNCGFNGMFQQGDPVTWGVTS